MIALFSLIGIAAIGAAALIFAEAASAIHEILAAVAFGVGLISLGFAALIDLGRNAVKRMDEIAENTRKTFDLMVDVRRGGRGGHSGG